MPIIFHVKILMNIQNIFVVESNSWLITLFSQVQMLDTFMFYGLHKLDNGSRYWILGLQLLRCFEVNKYIIAVAGFYSREKNLELI